MELDRIIRLGQPRWSKLQKLVVRANSPTSKLQPSEVRELLQLYQDASADLARVRTLEADDELIANLNRLIASAHATIYRSDRTSKGKGPLHFYVVTYPRIFRETWKFTLAAFLLSALVFAMAYETVQTQPDIVADILGGADHDLVGRKDRASIADRFEQTPGTFLTSVVTTNNIGVAITAFALGLTFGVGTVIVLIVNGAMLGGIAGAYAKSGAGTDLWMTILPHGALELSAIVCAGGAGLLLGYTLWCPGGRTRRLALREEAPKAVLLAVGLIPAFVIAGIFEGFLTPTLLLSQTTKVAIGVLVAAAFWLHLLIGGRGMTAAELADANDPDEPAVPESAWGAQGKSSSHHAPPTTLDPEAG